MHTRSARRQVTPWRLVVAPALLVVVPSAIAHVAGDGASAGQSASGFLIGFLHPLTGPDHLVAMIAVGLWGAILGLPALWLLPIAFPIAMAAGGALGVAGIGLPAVEIVIAASAVVLGALVASAVRLRLAAALALVAVFAVFHGHAHGTELPSATSPIAYSAGFVVATGLLHLAGVAIGTFHRPGAGTWVVRGAGIAVALTGVAFLVGHLGSR